MTLFRLIGFGLATLLPFSLAAQTQTRDSSAPRVTNPSYSVRNHPVLCALVTNTPSGSGRLNSLGAITCESLHDPVANKVVLVALDRSGFTLIPRQALLTGSRCSHLDEVVEHSIPRLPYLPLERVLASGPSLFSLVTVSQCRAGSLIVDEPELLRTHPDAVMVLIDASTGRPVERPVVPPS